MARSCWLLLPLCLALHHQVVVQATVYVLDLSLTAQTSSIYASWTLNSSVASQVKHYEVSWQPPDNGGSATSSSYEYTITGLSACTTYTVSVQPINSSDLTVGDPAVESTTTSEEDPPRVATVTVNTVVDDSSSLDVSWAFSETFICDVTFRVTWDAAPAEGTPEGETVLSNEYSYSITGLTAYTTYSVCVATQNNGVYSPNRCADGVTDEDVPGPPASVTVVGHTSSSIHVSWEAPTVENGVIIQYEVSWTPDDGSATVNASTTQNDITGLQPCTTYTISVTAATSKGAGPSADTTGATDSEAPGPVTGLQVDTVQDQSSQLKVCWTPPVTNCDLQYTITWSPVDGDGGLSITNENCSTITGLTPFTTYSVCVAAGTLDDKFSAEQCADGTTDEDVPGPPASFTVVGRTSQSIQVSWEAPTVTNGVIIQYEVSWTPGGGPANVNNTTTNYNITDLQPCTTYTISVTAATSKGAGPSADTTGTTDSEVPAPEVTCSEPSTDQLTVSWTANTTCTILSFSVRYSGLVLWSEETQNSAPKTYDNTTTSVQLPGLTPWTEYTVMVTVNVPGTAIAQGNCFATTQEAAPGPPVDLAKNASSSTTLTLTWRPPLEVNGRLSGYIMTWNSGQRNLSAEDNYATIDHLEADTQYTIELKAATGGGWGNATSEQYRTNKTPAAVGAIVGGVLVGLLVVVVLVVGFVYRDRLRHTLRPRTDKTVEPRTEMDLFPPSQPPPPPSAAPAPAPTPAPPPPHPPPRPHSRPLAPSLPVLKKDVKRYIQLLEEDGDRRLEEEFRQLQKSSPHRPCTAATSACNTDKNRYRNILPFDHSRVVLDAEPGVPGSDYINASHLQDIDGRNLFVASQGPLLDTMADFWRMVWQLKIYTIIMLTKPSERGRQKCAIYWPSLDMTPLTVGQFSVSNSNEENKGFYVVRYLVISKGEQKRLVKQYHYTSWPDFGAPDDQHELLNFVSDVRKHLPSFRTPILVHCSAGVGRTGTFIALWNLMDNLDRTSDDRHAHVDVRRHVQRLREARANMVQSQEQYMYLWKSVAAYLQHPYHWRSHLREEPLPVYDNAAFERDENPYMN